MSVTQNYFPTIVYSEKCRSWYKMVFSLERIVPSRPARAQIPALGGFYVRAARRAAQQIALAWEWDDAQRGEDDGRSYVFHISWMRRWTFCLYRLCARFIRDGWQRRVCKKWLRLCFLFVFPSTLSCSHSSNGTK
ncbi:hypothetical protein BC835DRAFT_1011703 [Cytidiella melzeri]|nr:hypothetical protein BC835DRAFT_339704 [Cytidiella melzeri]KAI0694328.1 hypothetical protein BC835DRAFT_1011703 [Cytidiella melzeri]